LGESPPIWAQDTKCVCRAFRLPSVELQPDHSRAAVVGRAVPRRCVRDPSWPLTRHPPRRRRGPRAGTRAPGHGRRVVHRDPPGRQARGCRIMPVTATCTSWPSETSCTRASCAAPRTVSCWSPRRSPRTWPPVLA